MLVDLCIQNYALIEALELRVGGGAENVGDFFDTKADEIANIFRTASDPQQKQQVVTLLTEVDPTNTAKYQAILQR